MEHIGNLTITKDNVEEHLEITNVVGDLHINSGAKLYAPALTSVEGKMSIDSNVKLDAPALTSVGRHIYVHCGAKLYVLALTSVGGDLYINSGAKLYAPALTSVGRYLHINSGAKLYAPALYEKGFSPFNIIDGIACVVLSCKEVKNFQILSCKHSKIKDGKIVGDKFYIARRKNVNAYGNTIQEAIREFIFKTEKRK